MAEPIYKIHKKFKKKIIGCTNPKICSIYGVLKNNNRESPYCMYNEYVAVQLARLFKFPICDGILTIHDKQTSFVSLMLAMATLSLPDTRESQMYRLCSLYPQEVAEIFAFDMLIGNYDRGNHIKATFVSPEFPLFRGFDHSNALLGLDIDPNESLASLASNKPIIELHPFAPYVSKLNVSDAIDEMTTHRDGVGNRCLYEEDFLGVHASLQLQLATVLTGRLDRLQEIFENSFGRMR